MEMNDEKLKTLAITLRWEARYRQGEHLTGEGAFLPELATLDRDFAEALDRFGVRRGRLLEIGTGVGRQAICYARAGFEVTAVDVSATAIEQARRHAEMAGLGADTLRFAADNILHTGLKDRFDVIADRGCYATLKVWEWPVYARNVHGLLKPDGLFLLKINAGQQKRLGPLEAYFLIEQSYDTHYHGEPRQGPPAGFFILKPIFVRG